MRPTASDPKVSRSISLDADVADWLRRHCAETDVNASRVVNRALRRTFGIRDKEATTNGDHKPAA